MPEMYEFSKTSKERLATCDIRLQTIMYKALRRNIIDITIEAGHRTKTEQLIAFQEGRSPFTWPESKHNKEPSLACDAVPYCSKIKAVDWKDLQPFYLLAGIVLDIATEEGYPLIWGGAWNGNLNVWRDNPLNILMDLGHYELNL